MPLEVEPPVCQPRAGAQLGRWNWLGMWKAPCWVLYRFWLGLPVYAHKRQHSTSGSTNGRLRNKAKEMRYADTGRYALPW